MAFEIKNLKMYEKTEKVLKCAGGNLENWDWDMRFARLMVLQDVIEQCHYFLLV